MKTYSVRVMEVVCYDLKVLADNEQKARESAEEAVVNGKSTGWSYSIEADEVVEEVEA